MPLVTIYTTHNYIEAGIIKGRLESEGIFCFLKDENSVTIDPLIGYSINWIKIQVQQEDAGLAKVILDTPGLAEE